MKVEWAIAMEARFEVEAKDWSEALVLRDQVRRSLDNHMEAVRLTPGLLGKGLRVKLVTTAGSIPEEEDSAAMVEGSVALGEDPTKLEEYSRLRLSGLSDSEARGTVWPEDADS